MEGIVLALLVCLILALLTKHLSAPVTPFYILAGIVVGTSGLKIVAADDISHFSTELGLIFLLLYLNFLGNVVKTDFERINGFEDKESGNPNAICADCLRVVLEHVLRTVCLDQPTVRLAALFGKFPYGLVDKSGIGALGQLARQTEQVIEVILIELREDVSFLR